MTTKTSIAADKPPLRIIRKLALRERLGGCSDHHIADLVKREGFPRHIRLGGRSVGWLVHEVDAWIERRMSERKPFGSSRRPNTPSEEDDHRTLQLREEGNACPV
jgi:predicted DNA-binding transcriptional regulator AlpA